MKYSKLLVVVPMALVLAVVFSTGLSAMWSSWRGGAAAADIPKKVYYLPIAEHNVTQTNVILATILKPVFQGYYTFMEENDLLDINIVPAARTMITTISTDTFDVRIIKVPFRSLKNKDFVRVPTKALIAAVEGKGKVRGIAVSTVPTAEGDVFNINLWDELVEVLGKNTDSIPDEPLDFWDDSDVPAATGGAAVAPAGGTAAAEADVYGPMYGLDDWEDRGGPLGAAAAPAFQAYGGGGARFVRPKSFTGTGWSRMPGALCFYERGAGYYEFTNFYEIPGGVRIDGRNYRTTEHYYQSQKFTQNAYVQGQVMAAATARDAFTTARTNAPSVDADWRNRSLATMAKAVWIKFSTNQTLRGLLLGTSGRVLVEAAGANDPFFGNGPGDQGTNYLGRILMWVREHLENGTVPVNYDPAQF